MSFNIFSHYASTQKKDNGNYLTSTAYGGFRSALFHVYRMSGTPIPDEMRKEIAQFMSGMKRTVAASRATNGQSLDEGKKSMSVEVYTKMCELLYKGKGADCIFAHAFLTMEWNLLARSDNCLNMKVAHVHWSNDALLFYFAKSKGDQVGARSDHPWHVYSNPKHPELCPVLALAEFVLCNPSILKKLHQSFQAHINMNDS